MATVFINTNDEELDPVWAARQNVGRQCRCALDGHGLLTSQFEKSHFSRKRARQGLRVAHQPSGGEGEVVTDLEELLNALVGDEMAHGCTVVCTNDNASFEGDTHGACSGLHHGLVF